MTEEDAPPVPKTFEELFKIYSNYKLDPLDVDNEVYDSILLSQIDLWLEKSQLMKTVFTQTETGMAWLKFKKWRLDLDEFTDMLKELCAAKNMDIEDVKTTMTDAGPPSAEAETNVVVK